MANQQVLLVGNPNTGKSTLFNRLTGTSQQVGNWPGVTVEKKSGQIKTAAGNVGLVDLPGIYNLAEQQTSIDENIARKVILENQQDLIINVIDAANLTRNLKLTYQIINLNSPAIVVVNMLDVAEQQGMKIDIEKLAQTLNVPAVGVIASTGQGIDELKKIIENLKTCELKIVNKDVLTQKDLQDDGFEKIQQTAKKVLSIHEIKTTISERLDKIALNKWLGLPLFFLMIYLMFTISINIGAVFIDFFDILFGAFLVDGASQLLNLIHAPAWLITLIASGLGGGIQLVATFIPVIGFLYLCLSFLEDSGYMSRAAFVVDHLMQKIGLPGNAFVPLIVGFGCNVPSVIATRSLRSESDRLRVILMAPFMSCGARLTVYALFAAAFFPENGQNIVFLLYLLGIAMAVITAWLFRKTMFTEKSQLSFTEMPAYHLPIWRNIFINTWFRLKGFIFSAGKTIVLVVVALSFLNSIGSDSSFGNEDSNKSVLSEIGKSITPAFTPMGVSAENWPAAVGLFTGMFAKEAVVGTLDSLYQSLEQKADAKDEELNLLASTKEAFNSIWQNAKSLSQTITDPLGISIGDVSNQNDAALDQGVESSTINIMKPLFAGTLGAFCYLVFILLYAPCVAVLGAITREAGARWTTVVFIWSTSLAYVTAVSIYQMAFIFEQPLISLSWVAAGILWLGLLLQAFKKWGKPKALPAHIIAVG